MITKTSKIDDYTIGIDIAISETASNQYDYDDLLLQRQAILEQKQKDNDLRDAEILEIDSYIQEANKLGIRSRKEKMDGIAETANIRHN